MRENRRVSRAGQRNDYDRFHRDSRRATRETVCTDGRRRTSRRQLDYSDESSDEQARRSLHPIPVSRRGNAGRRRGQTPVRTAGRTASARRKTRPARPRWRTELHPLPRVGRRHTKERAPAPIASGPRRKYARAENSEGAPGSTKSRAPAGARPLMCAPFPSRTTPETKPRPDADGKCDNRRARARHSPRCAASRCCCLPCR